MIVDAGENIFNTTVETWQHLNLSGFIFLQ